MKRFKIAKRTNLYDILFWYSKKMYKEELIAILKAFIKTIDK